MFIFLKRSTTDLNSDTLSHPTSPASPPNSEDTLGVRGKHLSEDISSLFTLLFEGLDIGEDKIERIRQDRLERMFQPGTLSPFRLSHDSKAAKSMSPREG